MTELPKKITCIGRNYVEHINELGNAIPDSMVVFNKPPSSVTPELLSEHLGEALHYEGELCFVIKDNQAVKVGFALDLTKRSLQSELKAKGLPWERDKSFDGAIVVSDFVTIDSSDIADMSMQLFIDDELVQHGYTSHMLYPVATAITELSQWQKMDDGDWLLTGTPKGVGVVKAGQVFVGKVLINDKEIISVQWRAQ